MATNWTIPTGTDIKKVLSIQVFNDANQNTGDDVTADQQYDPQQPNRADFLMGQAVAQIRAAIQNAGSVPLSVTAGSIPPEADRYAIDIAAYQLIISTPNLKMVIITDKGVSSPFAVFYREAMDWLEKVRKGIAVTPPTDPCGADWVNPVGAQINAVPASAVYDVQGQYILALKPGLEYTWNKGANDISINAYGAVTTVTPNSFIANPGSVVLIGTAGAAVTATLIFDNPPVPGMVRYGGTTAANPVDLTTWDAPQPVAFDTQDLGQP